MSNPVVDEPGATAPDPDAEAAAAARDRSQTTEDASARDWADTGEPGHRPATGADGSGVADDEAAPADGALRDGAPAADAADAAAGADGAGPSSGSSDPEGGGTDGATTAPPAKPRWSRRRPGVGKRPDPTATATGSDQAGPAAAEPGASTVDATEPDSTEPESTDVDATELGLTASKARESGPAEPGPAEPGPAEPGPSAPAATPPAPAAPEQPAAPEPAAPQDAEPRQVVRATGPPRRPPMIVQGLWPALLAGALAAATTFGLLPLAVAVLAVQVFLILGALALLDAPASGGAFLVATGTTLAADALVLTDDGRVTGLAGAAGLGLVASLVHQLARKGRSRVTESLADTLVVIVVSVAAACLLALQQTDGGEQVLLVSLAATGAVLLAGRIGDRLAPRPMLAIGSTRGWPGLLLGLGAGVSCALLVADAGGELPLRSAALLGLVVASTVATADLAVDLGAAELRSGWRDARRVAALRPTALLLPYAVLGPVALLAGRLVLR